MSKERELLQRILDTGWLNNEVYFLELAKFSLLEHSNE